MDATELRQQKKKKQYENGKECNIANGKRKMALVKKMREQKGKK